MRQLRWLLLFIPLVLAGDRLGAWILRQQVESSQFRYSRMYKGGEGVGILLMGNSRGLMYYQPAVEALAGVKTANLSYNGISADLAAALCMDYIERNQGVRHLLVDITMLDRENNELLSGFSTYSAYSPRLDALIRKRIPTVWWGTQLSHLFRYNNEVFQRALYYRNRSDKDWLIDRIITDRLVEEKEKFPFEFKENAYLVEQLKELVAFARQRQVEVHLLIGPYFPGFKPTGLDALKARVETATGLKVHDFRDALTLKEDFGDLMHPNKAGSQKYMEMLDGLGVF